ncbi:MAG: ParB/RepB/Spo0J family partition protein [Oscillospiraceae bacterium]|nr:ParB/RepB/Spo0J family partition protein [Oscillospiraceae bacterium]
MEEKEFTGTGGIPPIQDDKNSENAGATAPATPEANDPIKAGAEKLTEPPPEAVESKTVNDDKDLDAFKADSEKSDPNAKPTAEEKAEAEKKDILDEVVELDISQIQGGEEVKRLPLTELHGFKGHPFVDRTDKKYLETLASIKQGGVHTPIIARPRKEGGFEIISGHRRSEACKELGKTDIPVLIRDLSDADASIIMVDTNINRERQLPSERAKAIEIQLDVMKQMKGKAKDGEVAKKPPEWNGKKPHEVLAKQLGISTTVLYRQLSVLKLIPPLIKMVDTDKLRLDIGEVVAGMKKPGQEMLFKVMDANEVRPTLDQAKKIAEIGKNGKLELAKIEKALKNEKPLEFKVTITGEAVKDFFPKGTTPKEMETGILKALEFYKTYQEKIKNPGKTAPPKKPNIHGKGGGTKPPKNSGAR